MSDRTALDDFRNAIVSIAPAYRSRRLTFRQFSHGPQGSFSQVPQESTMQPTPPMSSTLNLVTALPTARTRPMIS